MKIETKTVRWAFSRLKKVRTKNFQKLGFSDFETKSDFQSKLFLGTRRHMNSDAHGQVAQTLLSITM